MALVIWLGLLVVAVILFKYFLDSRKFKNFPPGPPRLPLIGSLPFMPGSMMHQHAERHWRAKYGNLVGLTTGSGGVVMVCGAEEVLAVLNHEHCQVRPESHAFTERAFGGKRLGVMFSDGAYWTEQRRFALRELRDLGLGKSKLEGVVLDEVQDTLDVMCKDGPAVVPNKLFNAPVLNMLWWMVSGRPFARSTATGIDSRSQHLLDMMNKAMRNKRLATAPCDIWPFLKYIAPDLSAYNEIYPPIFELHKFLRDEIKQQRQSDGGSSFMSKYCEEIDKSEPGSGFTEESLIVTCLDLFMAGGESTANTLSYCLLYMAKYPEVQAKVHAELDAVCGGADKIVTLSDKASLPYLEATLTEVMRIDTIAPLAIPHCNRQEIQLNGYTIPKGTLLQISLWILLNDKKHWGDPEKFRPERFLDKDGRFVKDPWMAPFGLGKRICIGDGFTMQVASLFFANLMNRFNFAFPAGTEAPSTAPVPGLTVTPQLFTVLALPRT